MSQELVPILSVQCNEPEGKVWREVYPFFITAQNLSLFWNAAKQFPTIYGHKIESLEDFMNLFMSIDAAGNYQLDGLFYAMPNEDGSKLLGMFYITNITEIEADVHYTFFDKRHKGRIPLLKELIGYVFRKYNFRRMNAIVPCYTSNFVRYFVNNIGFKLEGKKRSVAPYMDKWFDILFYGMLQEEFFAENPHLAPDNIFYKAEPSSHVEEVTPDKIEEAVNGNE